MLAIDSLSAAFGKVSVLDRIHLRLPEGETGVLLGPSGSGKTTLLRILAGFEQATAGSVHLNGELLNQAGWGVAPERRGFAMVFQDLALLPHLNARDNVAFSLHALPRAQARKQALDALALVGLEHNAKSYPHQLSGGQMQRVAVARTLAMKPRLLLLDEPFSSLDEDLRIQLRNELRRLLQTLQITALMVTHSQLEAFALADWVGVLSGGQLDQWDTPYNLYHRPMTRRVADFVGEGVFIPGHVRTDGTGIDTEIGLMQPSPQSRFTGPETDVLLRCDDVIHDDDSPWRACITRKHFRGATFLYELELASGTRVLSLVPSHHNHRLGEAIGIRLNLEHVICFDRQL